ncbi:hypothetical protein PTKIN_Ptkin04bG0107300 [Pterospermum kingtungense]
MSVEDYNVEFKVLMIKGDFREAEEQTIAKYISRLNWKIAKVVDLQFYHTLKDVMKLALKFEAQNKYKSLISSKSYTRDDSSNVSGSKAISSSKPTSKVTSEVFKLKQAGSSSCKGIKCFKCLGIGNIASECPYRRAVAYVKFDGVKEED